MLRRLPTRRLLMLCALVVAIGAVGATVAAGAFGGGGPVPPARSLAQAVHAALAAPPVKGISADVEFTNHLIDSSSLRGSSPLITGAKGRLWIGGDRLRLELQATGDRQAGDSQLLVNGRDVTLLDVATNTVYRAKLPARRPEPTAAKRESIPTVAQIKQRITQLLTHVNLVGPSPQSIGGQSAYSVRISPKHDAGLLGSAQLGWDALHGVPLSAAVYAQGNPKPVLALVASNVHYGPVAATDLEIKPSTNAKVVALQQPADAGKHAKRGAHPSVTGLAAVRGALPFAVSAPSTLVGLPQQQVRLLDFKGSPAALVTFGRGLGGLAVIEQKAKAPAASKTRRSPDRQLPTVSIGGATGTELATALGTVVTFERGGVRYTILGSVPPAAAEAAARGL